ncbi:MAG: acyl-CoA thioesterase [Hespellia sp.]|nr:acyl-CoA thioesterase [Hespellia sp.]
MDMNGRTVENSIVETTHIIRPNHLNGSGRLFGGILMQWIDEVAALSAMRHARTNVTTVSVDNLNFMKSARSRDVVVLRGHVTHVGNTSLEVQVDTYVEAMDGNRHMINRAFLTLVCLGENDAPTKVAPLVLQTFEEKEAWKAGEKRREMRKTRKEEGF